MRCQYKNNVLSMHMVMNVHGITINVKLKYVIQHHHHLIHMNYVIHI
jgi:hypothetical protein